MTDETKRPAPKGLTDEQARALAARIRREAGWARATNGKIASGIEVLGFDAASDDKGAVIRVESATGFWTITDGAQVDAFIAANKK